MSPMVDRSDVLKCPYNHSTRNIPVWYVTHDSDDNKS